MPIRTLAAAATEHNTLAGRAQEVQEVARLMARSRLLTLAGPIGTGKSALAIGVARYRRAAFVNGVFVADLGRPDDTVDAVRGMSFEAHGRGVLLVLDNCDAFVEDAAMLVSDLLSSHGELRVLVTGRQVLQLPGEVVVTVRPLEPAAAHALFTGVAEDLTAEICAELDGLPVALRHAADGLRQMPAHRMLRTIRSAENSAYDGSGVAAAALRECSPAEREICAELAVFRGSFSLEAAEYVCGGPVARIPVGDAVAALLDKSVLAKRGDDSSARYVLPRIFQRHGRKQLAGGLRSHALLARLAGWYRHTAATAAAEFFTGRQRDWLRFLAEEMPNITAALDHCVAERHDVPTGLELATALAPYWLAVGEQLEPTWLLDALKLYEVPDARRGAGLAAASRVAMRSARIDIAHAMNNELGNLLDEYDDPTLRREYAEVTALAEVHDRCTDSVLPRLEDARAACHAAADDAGTWRLTTCLAFATSALGNETRGRAYVDASLALVSAAGAEWSRATSLWVAAFQQWRRRNATRAAALAREALALEHGVGDLGGAAVCLELLAWTAAQQNRHGEAARLLGAAATVTEEPATAFLPRAGLDHDWCVDRLVRRLGEHTYARAYRVGAQASFDETVRSVLNARPPLAKPEAPDGHPLTPRELEIARGIALGRTNREIAASLAVAKRTAEAHLESILAKLNLASRAQVAAWVAGHDRIGQPGRS